METEQAKQIMGRIVAALREERLMSRYALAKRAGVDCSWLRRFEQGRSGVRVETLIAIAQGLPNARRADRGSDRNRPLRSRRLPRAVRRAPCRIPFRPGAAKLLRPPET